MQACMLVPRSITHVQDQAREDLPCMGRDSLLLDCVPLSSGSTVPECFVEGLAVVDECTPNNASATPLNDLLAAGKGADGSEGSLCSLAPGDGEQVGQPARRPASAYPPDKLECCRQLFIPACHACAWEEGLRVASDRCCPRSVSERLLAACL